MFDFYPGGFAALFVNSFQTAYKQYSNVHAQRALRVRTRKPSHTRVCIELIAVAPTDGPTQVRAVFPG